MSELRSSYRHNTRVLADAGFRVAAMDLRGHGDSDATFSAYDVVAAGTDVLALVEELGGPALLVGNSMGAGAAVWPPAERPDLATSVLLVGPFVRQPIEALLIDDRCQEVLVESIDCRRTGISWTIASSSSLARHSCSGWSCTQPPWAGSYTVS